MALTVITPIHGRAFLLVLAFLIALSTLEELACHAQEDEYVVAFDLDQDKDPGESGQPEEEGIFTGSPLVDTPYKQEHFIPTQTQEEKPLLQQVDYQTNHTGNKTAFLEIHITHHMARASSNRSQGEKVDAARSPVTHLLFAPYNFSKGPGRRLPPTFTHMCG